MTVYLYTSLYTLDLKLVLPLCLCRPEVTGSSFVLPISVLTSPLLGRTESFRSIGVGSTKTLFSSLVLTWWGPKFTDEGQITFSFDVVNDSVSDKAVYL